jgi:farnesyl-diphosphate farnesyltransferase
MEISREKLLTNLLKDVSRSFYLTLRVLPASVRSQIGLAYLLARASDTIADTEIIPVDGRLRILRQYRDCICGINAGSLDVSDLIRNQGSEAERALLQNIGPAIDLLNRFGYEDQQLIRKVIEIIISGQELDLHRFSTASEMNVVALNTDSELDDYTYRVAGCVGEFWTKTCLLHQIPRGSLFNGVTLTETEFLGFSVRFGKGLQLVNILRDLPADLKMGRCYLPLESLRKAKLTPAELQIPSNWDCVRPIYDAWLARAEGHLKAGWAYTNAIPRSQVRLRLACAWPVLIGVRTLELLRLHNVLEPSRRIRVSRPEVKAIMFRSVLLYPFPAWHQLPERYGASQDNGVQASP